MKNLRLQRELRETSTAYLLWFFLGAHYAYIGKWGLQIAYWLTLGGLGLWALVDLFRMPSIIREHNEPIYAEIEKQLYK